jgi:hypothetical protein
VLIAWKQQNSSVSAEPELGRSIKDDEVPPSISLKRQFLIVTDVTTDEMTPDFNPLNVESSIIHVED